MGGAVAMRGIVGVAVAGIVLAGVFGAGALLSAENIRDALVLVIAPVAAVVLVWVLIARPGDPRWRGRGRRFD